MRKTMRIGLEPTTFRDDDGGYAVALGDRDLGDGVRAERVS